MDKLVADPGVFICNLSNCGIGLQRAKRDNVDSTHSRAGINRISICSVLVVLCLNQVKSLQFSLKDI